MTQLKLFHISFKGDLEGLWTPRNPDGLEPTDDGYKSEAYPEPLLPRISCAPTIIQCFQAIYANVKHYFDDKKYPYMEFYVYSPVLKGNEKILTPEVLTRKKMVHDAFLTKEHAICSPVKMELLARIKISNIKQVEKIYYHPFNDEKKEKDSWIPGGFDYSVIHKYKNVVLEEICREKPIFTKW